MDHHQWEERLVHYQYVLELLEDRHVLEIGCGNGSGTALLAEVARRVVTIDTSQERLRRHQRAGTASNVCCMMAEPDRIQVKDQVFDAVLVPELERWVTRGALLPEIRRVLAPGGVVLLAVPSTDRRSATTGMAFADLEEYLSQSFEHVRLVGVIPFSGTILADFRPEGEIEPQLDCTLVEQDEEPVTYLALCSREPLAAPGYTVLQVPRGAVETGRWASAAAQPEVVTRLLDREVARASVLEERLDQARQQNDELSRRYFEEKGRVEVDRVRAQAAEGTIAECRHLLDEQRKRAESAERRCDALMIRMEQGAAELSTLHHRMAELQGLRQADQWHIDELVGRLRKAEQGSGGAAVTDLAPRERRELELARLRIGALERESLDLKEAAVAAVDASEVGQLRQQVTELEAQLVAAEQRSASAAEQAKKLEKRAGRAEQRLQEVERQSGQQLQEKAELEKELMRSESRVVEHSRRATNAESKIVQMEVRLKRSEAEAATLSKWAEELREELKEAQGKSTARPATPEPEVAALRNDLRSARERITALEQRCDSLIAEVQQGKARLAQKEQQVQAALEAVDSDMLQELMVLRQQTAELPAIREQLRRCEGELRRAESDLRDGEQSQAELARTRAELEAFRQSVRDVDAASEELEQLRLASMRQLETERELERLREELEGARIELARSEEELRGAGGRMEQPGFSEWEAEEEVPEVDRFVGPDLEEEGSLEEEDAEWDLNERLRVQERQLEALLEGAALHRTEMERQQAQVEDMDALVKELQAEQRVLEQRLGECRDQRSLDQQSVQRSKEENVRLGRELARVQGELRRCHEEQVRLEKGMSSAGVEAYPAEGEGMKEDLEREARRRQKLEQDLEQRLAELDVLRRELRNREQALDRLRSEDTEHRADLRELRRQVRDLERQAESCQRTLAERQTELDRLVEELAQARRTDAAGAEPDAT